MPAPSTEGAPTRLRVLINALHSKSGGGVTYLNNIVPALDMDPELEIHLLLHADQLAEYEKLADHARLHLFDFREGLIHTLFWEQFILPLVVRMMNADVVYSPANYGPLLVSRSVVLARNSLAVARMEARPSKILYWAGVASMTLLSLWTAKRAVAVSHYIADSLNRWPFEALHRKLTVINHGVSPVFQPGDNRRGDTLLAVGDIYIQKNYHTLLDAFSRLLKRHPGLTLTVAGKPLDIGYADLLHNSIRRLGLGSAVRFLGHVDPADLCRLYQECGVFVFPSTVETFGNPLVEALACGAPIACSNRTAMPEIAGDAVEYFDPENADDMVDAINRLLTDQDLRAEYSNRALARAGRFSWALSAQRLADQLKLAAS